MYVKGGRADWQQVVFRLLLTEKEAYLEKPYSDRIKLDDLLAK